MYRYPSSTDQHSPQNQTKRWPGRAARTQGVASGFSLHAKNQLDIDVLVKVTALRRTFYARLKRLLQLVLLGPESNRSCACRLAPFVSNPGAKTTDIQHVDLWLTAEVSEGDMRTRRRRRSFRVQQHSLPTIVHPQGHKVHILGPGRRW